MSSTPPRRQSQSHSLSHSQSGSPPSSPTPRISGQWPFRPGSLDIQRKQKASSHSSSGSGAADDAEDRPTLWPPPSLILMDGGRSRSSRKGSKTPEPTSQRRSRSHSRPRSFMMGRKSKSSTDGGTSSPESAGALSPPQEERKEMMNSKSRDAAMLSVEKDLQRLVDMNNRGSLSVQRASVEKRSTEERELQKVMDLNNRRSITTQRASFDHHRAPSKEDGNEPQRMPIPDSTASLEADIDTMMNLNNRGSLADQRASTDNSPHISPRKSTSASNATSPLHQKVREANMASASVELELQKLMDMNNRGSMSQQRVSADMRVMIDEKELQRLMDRTTRGSITSQRASLDVGGTSSPKHRKSVGPSSPVIGESPAELPESELQRLMDMNTRGSIAAQRASLEVGVHSPRHRKSIGPTSPTIIEPPAILPENDLQKLMEMNTRGSIASQRATLDVGSQSPRHRKSISPTSPTSLDSPKSKKNQLTANADISSISAEAELNNLMNLNNKGSLNVQRASVENRSTPEERELQKLMDRNNRGSLGGQRAAIEPVSSVSKEAENDFRKMMEMNNRGSLGVQRASTTQATSPQIPEASSSVADTAAAGSLVSPVTDLRNNILRDIHSLSSSPAPDQSTPSSPTHPHPLPRDVTASSKPGSRTPPRSPYILPGESRADKIAQLVRQHKETSKDPVTGQTVIPKRTTSYGIDPEERERLAAALDGAASAYGSEAGGASGLSSQIPSPTSSEPADGTGLPPSGALQKPPASVVKEATVGNRGDLPPPLVLPTGAAAFDDSPVDEEAFDYKTLEPIDIATRLFNLTLPGVGKDKICQIIGKGDEFHISILNNYMELYEFYGMSLDGAFRHLCGHLQLNGETQQVDRILYQFSKRFWDCNVDAQSTFRSIDIVYGILFSLVLLNTDLHIANVGSSNMKKMQRKTFVKNTSELIDKMIVDDETVRETFTSLGTDGTKRWKKDIESMLKDLYTSVKDNRILQRPGDPDIRNTSFDNYQSPGGTSTLMRRSNSMGKRSSGVLKTSRSAFFPPSSNSPSTSGGLMNSPSSYFRSNAYTSTIDRKSSDPPGGSSTDSLGKDGRYSLGSHGSFGSGNILSSADNSISSMSNFPIDSSKNTPTSMGPVISPATTGNRRPSFSSESSGGLGIGMTSATGSSTVFNGREGVTLEGLLVRKHLTDHNETRAKNRRWAKVWCVMAVDDDRGVELTMFKVDPGVGDGEINFDERELADYGRPLGGEDSGGSQDLDRKSSEFGNKKLLRV
ncbi:hypothetical protein HDU67_010009, partial [Dinochytrium kinnereticum]